MADLSPHGRAVRACYERAKTILRQRHDAEFHEILSAEYQRAGLNITKRKSRLAAKAEKENTNE